VPTLSPPQFAQKWLGSTRTERAAAQEHFIDLCRMLDVPTPNEADPTGQGYAFEKGAEKLDGTNGFADVWRRGHFGWEYKGPWKDLRRAYSQLLLYREALENPPLLVVSDLQRFEVHTNFTNTPKRVYPFTLTDLLEKPEEPLRVLRAVMQQPEALKPGTTTAELTAEAAKEFASLADRLRGRGHDPHDVAHFLNKLVFCMFAEDAELLPRGLIGRLTYASAGSPDVFTNGLDDLFSKMADKGGLFGAERIDWFNGGLFDGGGALPLTADEIRIIRTVSGLDWSQVEPAIFGTLFERGLDPSKRSQLGAHYTDRESIERLIEPVLIEPLRRDFEATKARVEELIAEGRKVTARTPADKNPQAVLNAFLARLRAVRVLDPACGSGNFLYLALRALKNLEREALLWASLTLKVPIAFPEIGPQNLLGIELNTYAAELTRVVIWIGEIQWMLGNGFNYLRDPILRPLENIDCRDALLDETGTAEAEWPDATVIVGNPPFLGGKLMRTNLGDEYVERLFSVFEGRVAREADFVCYWHEKARAMVEADKAKRVGLLATQGIRGGASRRTLERVKETGDIFLAWDDEPWVVEGAAVHVSFVGFDDGSEQVRRLDDVPVAAINADLTAGIDLTRVNRLSENAGIAFMGDTKGGPFELAADEALAMLDLPNPDGRSNRDVVKPWANGLDLTRQPRGMWIVDFGSRPIEEAALYEAPFEYVRERVKPVRIQNRRAAYAERWWLHVEPRPAMRAALSGLGRYLGTPRVAKHRIFDWLPAETLPDSQIIVFARANDYFFGVLQSSVHELWARRLGTQLREVESGFRYTPTTTFETFPFPEPTADQRAEVAAAAARLARYRKSRLNPSPESPQPRLTMTQLYNLRPSWLANAQERLDRAVHAAYGWSYPLEPDDVLARLVGLNTLRVEARDHVPAAAVGLASPAAPAPRF
jgi:type II restriction/modification system DNA methylase subunit YeeA